MMPIFLHFFIKRLIKRSQDSHFYEAFLCDCCHYLPANVFQMFGFIPRAERFTRDRLVLYHQVVLIHVATSFDLMTHVKTTADTSKNINAVVSISPNRVQHSLAIFLLFFVCSHGLACAFC